MNTVIEQLIERRRCQSEDDYRNAFREITQEIALQGLYRGKFFERAAFYGGTALRIFYGLDRASEDMDFSLLKPDPSFRIASYGSAITKELESFGITATWDVKTKKKESNIDSAFLKMNTKTELLEIGMPNVLANHIPSRQQIKIKFEVDIDPPPYFRTEARTRLSPTPYAARLYTLPDLLAGKLHAILFRGWKNRVKGRDWFDLVWFAGNAPKVHLAHLEARIRQSNDANNDLEIQKSTDPLQMSDLKTRLHQSVEELDIDAARKDVRPFVRDPQSLDLWTKPFFHQVIDLLQPSDDDWE